VERIASKRITPIIQNPLPWCGCALAITGCFILRKPVKRPDNWNTFPSPETRGIKPVTLHDGRVVDNYSEEWRLECEARTILKIPSLYNRRRHLEEIERRRGPEAVAQIKTMMLALWKK